MPATITHAKSLGEVEWTTQVTIFNSSAGTVTAQGSDLVGPAEWNSAHQATLLVGGSEIFSVGFFEPFTPGASASTFSSVSPGVWWLDPFALPQQLGSGQLNIYVGCAAGFLGGAVYSATSSGTATIYETLSTNLCIYQLDSVFGTTQLVSVWSNVVSELVTWVLAVSGPNSSNVLVSNYLTASFPARYDASGGVTYSSTAQSGTVSTSASTLASTRADSLITGVVNYITGSNCVPVPFATELPAGEYYIGVMYSASSSLVTSNISNYGRGIAMSTQQSLVGMLEFVDQAYKLMGQSVSNTSSCMLPFNGSLASTLSAPPLNIAGSDMRNLAAPRRLVWNYAQTSH